MGLERVGLGGEREREQGPRLGLLAGSASGADMCTVRLRAVEQGVGGREGGGLGGELFWGGDGASVRLTMALMQRLSPSAFAFSRLVSTTLSALTARPAWLAMCPMAG